MKHGKFNRKINIKCKYVNWIVEQWQWQTWHYNIWFMNIFSAFPVHLFGGKTRVQINPLPGYKMACKRLSWLAGHKRSTSARSGHPTCILFTRNLEVHVQLELRGVVDLLETNHLLNMVKHGANQTRYIDLFPWGNKNQTKLAQTTHIKKISYTNVQLWE